MIFGNESISTYSKSNMTIWMALAFQGGLLNIGAFMACGNFVSHVTGFATLFGLEMESGNSVHALSLLIVPLFFLLGSMLSGVLVDLRLKLKQRPNYYLVFGVLFFLTLAVAIGGFNNAFADFGEPLTRWPAFVFVSLLCFTCGVQNGTVTLVSKAVVRTTHLTGVTTDLGIGLVRVLNRHRIQNLGDEGLANWMRLGIIIFFVLGSFVGAVIFSQWKYRGFLLPCTVSGVLFALTLYFQVFRKNKRL
ncbi:MAG: YoaK family protein [Bdellovibrionales bacterium]